MAMVYPPKSFTFYVGIAFLFIGFVCLFAGVYWLMEGYESYFAVAVFVGTIFMVFGSLQLKLRKELARQR